MQDLSVLNELLEEAFSDEELKVFCLDHFELVYEQFTADMSKEQIIRLLLEYCNRRQELPRLSTLIYLERPEYLGKDKSSTATIWSVPPVVPSSYDATLKQAKSFGPLRVFLAHASTDKPSVRKLYHRLRAEGFDPWLDEEDLLPGQDWQMEIRRAVRRAHAVIVCVSRASLTKAGYVQKEIKYALDTADEQPEGTTFIIPLKLEECEVPERLLRWQWVNLFEQSGFERLIRSLRIRADVLYETIAVVQPLEEGLNSVIQGIEEGVLVYDTQQFADRMIIVLEEFSSLIGLGTVIKQESRRFATFLLNTGIAFDDLPLPNPVPVLATPDRKLSDTTIENLRRVLTNSTVSVKSRIALLILFSDSSSLESARRRIARFLGDVYAFDVVVINHDELIGVAKAKEPVRALRRFMLSQVNLATVAPYTITGPTPNNFFFGREHELREITEHANSVSYAIIGGRRIGKTSIVNRLHRVRLPAAGFRTIYHDCSTTSTYESLLATKIRSWQPGPPPNAPATFGELVHSPPDDKPLVLLLDEADKLVPADRASGWQLFNRLRSLANASHAQIILSGERTLRDALRDSRSPLFNFANEIVLGPLDYRAVEVLVTQPMQQLEIELEGVKDIVDSIWSFTSGHPNIVQRLCRRLIERINKQRIRRIVLQDVNAVIEDSDFQRKDFLDTYWEAATHLERIISLLMANDTHVHTLSTVRQVLAERCNLRPKAREVDEALQRLVDLRSILKNTPSGYKFAVDSFPRVVAGTLTLQDVLEVLSEEYREQQV